MFFFKNRIKIYRLIENSAFKEAGIEETRPNVLRQIQVIKIKDATKTPDLLRINKLGDFNVTCQLPASTQYRVGILAQ